MVTHKINAKPPHTELNAELLSVLSKTGFTIDRFGHASKTVNKIKYRLKFMSRCVRIEALRTVNNIKYRSEFLPGESLCVRTEGVKWFRLNTVFYAAIKANKDKIYKLAVVQYQGGTCR